MSDLGAVHFVRMNKALQSLALPGAHPALAHVRASSFTPRRFPFGVFPLPLLKVFSACQHLNLQGFVATTALLLGKPRGPSPKSPSPASTHQPALRSSWPLCQRAHPICVLGAHTASEPHPRPLSQSWQVKEALR